ncbi:MAG: hypothetical protein M3R70_08495 [Actinomycetota bacterium]|nr:hypothetical protein [Actinomycetota bacterium]
MARLRRLEGRQNYNFTLAILAIVGTAFALQQRGVALFVTPVGPEPFVVATAEASD